MHVDVDGKRPIRRGGLKVLMLVAIWAAALSLFQGHPRHGGQMVWQDNVIFLLLFLHFPLRTFIFVPGYSAWFRDYWQRNVVGHYVDFRMNGEELVFEVQSGSKRNERWANFLVIQVPLGGWFAQCRMMDWSQDWKPYQRLRIRIKLEDFYSMPSLTVTDYRGATLKGLYVQQVFALMRRDSDFSRLTTQLLRNDGRFTTLLEGVADVLKEMTLTTRLDKSKEGKRLRVLLARKAADSLDADPRRERFEVIAEQSDRDPKEARRTQSA